MVEVSEIAVLGMFAVDVVSDVSVVVVLYFLVVISGVVVVITVFSVVIVATVVVGRVSGVHVSGHKHIDIDFKWV